MRRSSLPLVVACLLVTACSSAEPPMTRSCRGEYVDECRPYTYARITSASLSPEGITLDDPTMRAHLQVGFDRCAGHDMPTSIQISAFVGSSSDGSIPDPLDSGTGTSGRVIQLTTVPVTDVSATSLDTMIDNPFFTNVPADTTITLQFATIIDGCQGELFRAQYRTGRLRTICASSVDCPPGEVCLGQRCTTP